MQVVIDNNAEEFKKAMQEAVKVALEAIGIQAEGYAKLEIESHPRRVDTGLLRNSITHAVSGEPAAISTYKADKPDKSGKVQSGSYSGTAPTDPLNAMAVYVGSNVQYAAYV